MYKKYLILIIVLCLILITVIILIKTNPNVKDEIVVEAGSTVDAKDFLVSKKDKASYITDISTIDFKITGVYEVEIKVNSIKKKVKIKVIDTIPPTGKTRNLAIPINKEIDAKAFFTEIEDITEVTVFYVNKPSFSTPGNQNVELLLKDAGGNETKYNVTLTTVNVKQSISIEAGSSMIISKEDFKLDDIDFSFETDLNELDTSKVAKHKLTILFEGNTVEVEIDVIDTTPPEVEVIDKTTWLSEEIEAKAFSNNIIDASQVNVYYKVKPNFNKEGTQEVVIVFEDEYKNITEKSALLTVRKDTEAPIITGITDKIVYIDQTISYKSGVMVSDNRDNDVELKIDSSNVNIKKEGTYVVKYTATDKSGNTTTKEINIKVIQKSISEETLYKEVDKILAEIIKEEMTPQEKAHEIYKWIRWHVSYGGHTDPTDWIKEAYNGITIRKGDCFTFYAVSEALLTRAGIENMRIRRIGGKTNHYWNLVKMEDGWYHFDSCPHVDGRDSFMMTDARAQELTDKRGNNYYVYDKSLYPVIK